MLTSNRSGRERKDDMQSFRSVRSVAGFYHRTLSGAWLRTWRVGAVALALTWTMAVQSAGNAKAEAGPLTVFAAASLKTALDGAAASWMEKTGGRMRIAYAATSALARQIEHGAPADVFLSANTEWMDYLAERDLIDASSRVELFTNNLVLIAPKTSTVSLTLSSEANIFSALNGGRLAVANTLAVPAGIYAKQALTAVGLWREVRSQLVETSNVRLALSLVARGEAPLGVVYATDANAEPNVRVVATFAKGSHDPIVYMAALISSSGRPEARNFLTFLTTDAGAAHFLGQGFVRLR
jgi:molybdate transport system substrate-binding protein